MNVSPTAFAVVLLLLLVLQVQHKVSDAITSIDGELCFNIGVAAPLDANEADKMAWCVLFTGMRLLSRLLQHRVYNTSHLQVSQER